MTIWNIAFRNDADFAQSTFEDMYWSMIEMPQSSNGSFIAKYDTPQEAREHDNRLSIGHVEIEYHRNISAHGESTRFQLDTNYV